EKLEAPDAEQQAELERLRSQLAAAEKTLAALESQAPAPAAKPAGDNTQKKDKIDAALLRAQLRKAEKLEAPDAEQQAELERLRSQLAAAEKTLTELESQAPAPVAKPSGDDIDPLKRAKIELAMKRAELKKAEKAGAEE